MMAALALAMVLAALPWNASAQTKQSPHGESKWSTPLPSAKRTDKGWVPCPRYGEGFYRLRGSDTCIKFGGSVRSDVTITPGR
jgi:hypothetical protein